MDKTADCRFCLETDSISKLIAPCLCKGSAKYVHNDCLIEWTKKKPQTGHICNSCKYECVRNYPIEYERIPSIFTVNIAYGTSPCICILVHHFLFFMVAYPFFSKTNRYLLYICLQLYIHIVYANMFNSMIHTVRNKTLYMKLWSSTSRIYLPVMHLYLLCMIPYVQWIGGFGANMCMFMYYYEHYRILESINKQYKPVFINRIETNDT
jgi:hypothetical protein